MLACLYANDCAISHPDAQTIMEKAVALARKGAFLEPQNQLVRALLAYVFFVSGLKEHFFREAEQALQLNPNSPDIAALLGWGMALHGEWARGLPLLESGMQSNPFHPGWLHLAPYLNYYRQGQFDEAYYEAEKFNTPQLFWNPLLRAAALGQLGKDREAGVAVAELLEIRTDFSDCGRKLIGYFVKDPDLVEILVEGLRKAGLEV
jgi:adenylate cyclase